MTQQDILVWVVVTIAVIYAVVNVGRRIFGGKSHDKTDCSGGCDGCDGCD